MAEENGNGIKLKYATIISTVVLLVAVLGAWYAQAGEVKTLNISVMGTDKKTETLKMAGCDPANKSREIQIGILKDVTYIQDDIEHIRDEQAEQRLETKENFKKIQAEQRIMREKSEESFKELLKRIPEK